MNKRKFILFLLVIIFLKTLKAQSVELITRSKEAHFESHGPYEAYNGILVDEINEKLHIRNGHGKGGYIVSLSYDKKVQYNNEIPVTGGSVAFRLKNYIVSFLDDAIFLQTVEGNNIVSLYGDETCRFSFILKKDDGYIIYFIGENGVPGAFDSKGRIYTNEEAVSYLKKIDPEKFSQSLLRADELGIKNQYEKADILLWGDNYYSTLELLGTFYKNFPFISYELIQYDQNGYGYQMDFSYDKTKLCIINPDGTNLTRVQFDGYEKLIIDENSGIYSSWYVGFGGNIYYYIAGEEYTEVFRIRRTWGNPDFYALAINGYTSDFYGDYVNQVLPKMSKSDLRLLRNTIYALYGVHFKSEDLAKYFDKQVWYTDEGKTSGEVTLPEYRQKLVDMILKLEKSK